jgi:hypothetical protein
MLEADPRLKQYVALLVASFERYQGMRGRAFKLESYLGQFMVSETLPQVYSGERASLDSSGVRNG